MIKRGLCCVAGLILSLAQPVAQGMGLRSFVALPVEKGGTVLRGSFEHSDKTNHNVLAISGAYGISSTQTLLMGMPYAITSNNGDRLGDVSALYRHLTWQQDSAAGTDRVGLLGGVIIPTDRQREVMIQSGAVYTHYRGRSEFDIDLLYQQGLSDHDNRARYDLSWQYRISPTDYPEWGIPKEWYLVTELGGRYNRNQKAIHQFTLGIQWVAKRWVIEGGAIKDLNSPHQARYLFSIRFH